MDRPNFRHRESANVDVARRDLAARVQSSMETDTLTPDVFITQQIDFVDDEAGADPYNRTGRFFVKTR